VNLNEVYIELNVLVKLRHCWGLPASLYLLDLLKILPAAVIRCQRHKLISALTWHFCMK